MKTSLISILFVLSLFLTSCEKGDDRGANNNVIDEVEGTEYDLIGSAQKGPFINGSDVNVYELDKNFKPTGRSFYSNTDEKGYFEIKGLKLASPFVKVVVSGFYYNEISGDLSTEKLTLKAIVDLSAQNTLNINVLTNLEFDRVQYLISSKGTTIKDAKIQSQKEILAIFNFDSIQIENPESLDIIKMGEGDAVLLAISAILQANRTTAELSKLQSDIIMDMKEDGILNDSIIQTTLISQAIFIDFDGVRQNLVRKYSELGIDLANINEFDGYVLNFIENTSYSPSSPFQFPYMTSNGLNALSYGMNEFQEGVNYSFAVEMPNLGEVTIKIKHLDGTGAWSYMSYQLYGWKVNGYNSGGSEQVFTSIVNGELIDIPFGFYGSGSAIMEYYYNGSESPLYSKTITWRPNNVSFINYSEDSPMGKNLLVVDSTGIISDKTYSLRLSSIHTFDEQFQILFPESITVEVIGGSGEYSYTLTNGQLDVNLKNSEDVFKVSEIFLQINGIGTMTIESDLTTGYNYNRMQYIFLRRN